MAEGLASVFFESQPVAMVAGVGKQAAPEFTDKAKVASQESH